MDYEKIKQIIEDLLNSEAFRERFSANPEKAMSERNMKMTEKESNLLLRLTKEQCKNLKDHVMVIERQQMTRCSRVVVVCACGAGYFVNG